MKPVVVFNPFQAEFSYELSWHMPIVRELCETKYKDYHKIVIGLLYIIVSLPFLLLPALYYLSL